MRLLKDEAKKLVSMPMLWIFIALCLVVNAGLVFVYQHKIVDDSFFSYVGHTASITGNVLGDEFSKKLEAMPDSADKSRLVSETKDLEPVYENYDTGALAQAYIGVYGVTGAGAELLAKKYKKLEAAVQELNRKGAEFSLYSADTTAQMHDLLFRVILRAIITETCILAVLVMLYLFGYEHQSRTEAVVYVTKTGRRIFKYKFSAGILLSVICFLLISCVTLLVYFSVFDYSQIWDSSVSSGFNYISDMIGMKPFLTWVPFTVLGYLLAMLGLGLGLMLVFAMMGAWIGLLLRNSYVGVMLFFLLALAMMAMPYACSEAGIWGGYFLLQFSPARLWFVSQEWFTDMGSISVIPFHETAGVVFNMLLWGVLIAVSYRYVKRKDVVS